MILFAGAIAFGSVLNTALVSLSERKREVGTLRVLGYTTGQTARIFSGESLILNGIGMALGIVAGVGLAHAMAAAFDLEVYRFPVVIRPVTVLVAILAMSFFVALAQVFIYWMIRTLNWLEVLKVKE